MGPLAGAQAFDPHGGRWIPGSAVTAPALRGPTVGRRASCRGGGGAAGDPATIPTLRRAALSRAASGCSRPACNGFPSGSTGRGPVRLRRACAPSTGVGFCRTGAGAGAVRICPHPRTVAAAL